MPEIEITCPICEATHSFEGTDARAGSKEPFIFQCPNLDRRYRLIGFYVDTRRGFYKEDRSVDEADDLTKILKAELGEHEFDMKFKRWKQISYPPVGLIDEYPAKITQIINAFSMGYSYPAVTSACCLAERILNRLVLRCRNHFKSHPKYKKIYRKHSFDDWELMLGLIADWGLIPENGIKLYRELMRFRHQSIHYNEPYDFGSVAPVVVNKLIAAVTEVFGVINRKDIYLVFDVPGEVWIRSEAESLPFVKEFVIPHCYYAHAVHDADLQRGKVAERLGKIGPLSDDEFVELRKGSNESPLRGENHA